MEKKPLTTLVVEDDRSFRMYALDALRGNNNVTAETAIEAIEKFKANNPDIVFMDINLPDGNGLDLLQEMKKLNPKVYIVMVTGSRTKEDVAKAHDYKADGYIIKPFSAKKVQDFISKFISVN